MIFKNITPVDKIVITGNCTITLDSTCNGGELTYTGDVKLTDNSTVSPTFVTGNIKEAIKKHILAKLSNTFPTSGKEGELIIKVESLTIYSKNNLPICISLLDCMLLATFTAGADVNILINIKYIVNKIKNDSDNTNVDDESQLKSSPPAVEHLDSKAGTAKQSARAQARDMYEHELFFDISCAKVAREMTLGNGIISPDEEEALLTFLGEKNIEDKALFDDIVRANIPALVVLKMVKSKYINDESTLMDFLNNLFFIAESDGKVTENELNFIKKSASILGISSDELDVKIKERLVGFTESQAGEYILTENYDVLEDVLDEQDWEENDSGF
jgi:hypothetical protein